MYFGQPGPFCNRSRTFRQGEDKYWLSNIHSIFDEGHSHKIHSKAVIGGVEATSSEYLLTGNMKFTNGDPDFLKTLTFGMSHEFTDRTPKPSCNYLNGDNQLM